MIEGLDVGAPQGLITAAHWLAVKAQGKRFILARCVEGLGSIDATFAANVAGAKAVGLPVGAYFPLHPDLDPVKQALDHFTACKGLGTNPGELAPWLDIELTRGRTPAEVLAATIAWANAASLLWRRRIVVYTYEDFDHAELAGVAGGASLAGTDLSMAWYNPSSPPVPPPWARVTWWQNSGGKAYHLPSYAPCDTDVFLGTEEEFAAACDPTAEIVAPLSPDEVS